MSQAERMAGELLVAPQQTCFCSEGAVPAPASGWQGRYRNPISPVTSRSPNLQAGFVGLPSLRVV